MNYKKITFRNIFKQKINSLDSRGCFCVFIKSDRERNLPKPDKVSIALRVVPTEFFFFAFRIANRYFVAR